MALIIFFVLPLLSGFVLFRKNTVPIHDLRFEGMDKLSIIIPARNEEENLPIILRSIQKQTYQPFEIILVNDHSNDKTQEVAQSFGVKIVNNPPLPPGWTGKTWAVWNGYLHSSGNVLAFLDADINLSPHALECLLTERRKKRGVISVVPFHETKKYYERFALITNILGMFAFTSPYERKSPKKGLYGSCILTTREDYEKIDGHRSIKSELLDDLNLGGKFNKAGINVNNYIGFGLVSFRMYPQGIKSELQGFAKGALLSPNLIDFRTMFFTIIWIIGLIISEAFPFFISTSLFVPLLVGYLLYMFQIFYLVKYVGYFGKLMPIFHFLSTLFFLVVILYSAFQVVFLKKVVWKGRNIDVGRKDHS
jgi:4,4'-diaponeurosporenoate glycosyltransferase